MGANHNHEKHEHSLLGRIFGKNIELSFALLSGVFLLIGFLLSLFVKTPDWLATISYAIAYFFGGYYALQEAIEEIRNGRFEVDFLMLVAAIGAAYIDSWGEGALLLFLFSLGHALEHYAMNRATKSIESLGELSPKTAFIRENESLKEVDIEELAIGDVIVVKPHTKIAADGVIIKGSGAIDQAAITGESIPIHKTAIDNNSKLGDFNAIPKQHVVFTGTLNGNNVLEIRVLKLSKDSTIARLIQLVNEVETQKSPTQRLSKKFEKWFVPIVLIMVTFLCFTYLFIEETPTESLYRAITVLVASSPCALAISTPSAVLSGIARAAKGGVLIKGGKALEDLGSLNAIAFDKTGTLTEGKPKLTNIIPLNEFDLNELTNLIYAVENLSDHPLAKAIVTGLINDYKINTDVQATDVSVVQGMGVTALFENKTVGIGNIALMKAEGISIDATVIDQLASLQNEGHTAMLVCYNNFLIGLVSVMDIPRSFAASTLEKLNLMGIEHMIMLTGDHQHVGDAIAKQIGLTEVKGSLLPEDKVNAIKNLEKRESKIAMVGDGVNDAPAMAISTVGIAMGAAGSDVALETADVALMSDKLEKLPFVIGLSRKSKAIIKQNILISMGVVALLVPATILGWANIGIAVAFHEGSTLIVVINALRLLQFKERSYT